MLRLLLLVMAFLFIGNVSYAKEDENMPSDDGETFDTQAPLATPIEEILACPLGAQGEHTIRLLRRKDFFDSAYLYYLQRDQEEPVGLGHDEALDKLLPRQREQEYYRDWMVLSCQSPSDSTERIFFLVTAVNGRFLNTYALRYSTYFKEWQRLGVPVEEVPTHIYVNEKEFILIGEYPVVDRENPDDIFISSQYGVEGFPSLKKLPDPAGYHVIEIKPQIELNGGLPPEHLESTP